MIRSAKGSIDHFQSISSCDRKSSNPGRKTQARPHSKTTVVGASLKTRLHCNHLIPKCKCSSVNTKDKTHKTKHVVQGGSIQQRALKSSRALPRGEINGRKTYQSTDGFVSIPNGAWKPEQDMENRSKASSESHNHSHRSGDERCFKKKLRFEDEVTELDESQSQEVTPNSAKDMNSNKTQKQDIQPSPSTQSSSMQYRDYSHPDSEKKAKEMPRDYCRLCEMSDKGYLSGSNKLKKNDLAHNSDRERDALRYCLEDDHELRCPCHKYTNHDCIYGNDYCKICDVHLYSPRKGTAKSKQSLRQQDSSAQVPDGDNKCAPSTKIPYEPRTKFVQSLKEKLETNYMKEKSKNISSMEARAALRETESNEDLDRHLPNHTPHHIHHANKCLHHYQQNDRLFLEPTVTNRKGESVCGECGAAKPRNPQKEPYLYHITLGGLKTDSDRKYSDASASQCYVKDKENNTDGNRRSKKVPYDKSNFLYSKLNDSIDNIMGRKNIHSVLSRLSAPLNYHTSHCKRPPSRSMALMDHVIQG